MTSAFEMEDRYDARSNPDIRRTWECLARRAVESRDRIRNSRYRHGNENLVRLAGNKQNLIMNLNVVNFCLIATH